MKIPCFVLIYREIEIIRKCLEALMQEPRLEIHVFENQSVNSSKIRTLIKEHLNSKKIASHIVMEENITNNCFELGLKHHWDRINKSKYVILTDGDLVPTENWLNEQILILENNPDIFTCGVQLCHSNLPVHIFPEAINWLPRVKAIHDRYIEQLCGLHLLLFRQRDILDFLKFLRKRNVPFIDSTLHKYVLKKIRKRWATSLKSKAIHLTWNLYADTNCNYLSHKNDLGKGLWSHNRYCNYYYHTKDQTEYIKINRFLKKLLALPRIIQL